MQSDEWQVWAKHVLLEIERQGIVQRDQAEAINSMKVDIALIKQQTNSTKKEYMTKGGLAGTGLMSLIYAVYEFFINNKH